MLSHSGEWMPRRENSSPITALLLFGACLLAVYLRAACYRNFAKPDGGFWFYSPDPYDHLRRIALGVKSFPLVPSFDSYAAYPKGLGQIWSPLFDYLLSAAAVLFGGADTVIELVGFLANPVFSAATTAAVFFVARKAGGSDIGALLAAFVVAVFPGHIAYTLAPKLDHHVLEPLVILILFSCSLSGAGDRLSRREMAYAIGAFPLTILMWRGATLFWLYLFVCFFIRAVLDSFRGHRNCLDGYVKVFLGAAAAIATLCIFDPWQVSSGFSFNIVSWFHVVVLVLFAALMQILGPAGSVRELCLRGGGLLLLAAVAWLLPPVRGFAQEILSGVSFVGGTNDPWLGSVPEQQFFFKWGFWYGVIGTVTLLWLFIPLAAVLSFREWQRQRFDNSKLLAVIVWTAGMFPLIKLRYTGVMAIPVAIAVAVLISRGWSLWRMRWQRTALVASAPLLLSAGYDGYVSDVTFNNSLVTRVGEYGKDGVFEWIRTNTPPTSFYREPTRFPEYSILAPWQYGSKLSYLSHRPAVATAFGWEAHGLYEIGGFMATDKPEIAARILSRNRSRYLLVTPDSLSPYLRIAQDGVKKGALPSDTLGRGDGTGSMLQRLADHDGTSYRANGEFVPALQTYRLVYETPNPSAMGAESSYYKLFEVVPGAVLQGRCRAGGSVGLELKLRTSSGRLLTYADRKDADESGRFSFRVPYATGNRQGDTFPVGSYSVSCPEGGVRNYSVAEQDILLGKTVE